jgi:hypothetical protein
VNFNCTVIIEIKCTIVRHLQTFRIKNYATVRLILISLLIYTPNHHQNFMAHMTKNKRIKQRLCLRQRGG